MAEYSLRYCQQLQAESSHRIMAVVNPGVGLSDVNTSESVVYCAEIFIHLTSVDAVILSVWCTLLLRYLTKFKTHSVVLCCAAEC